MSCPAFVAAGTAASLSQDSFVEMSSDPLVESRGRDVSGGLGTATAAYQFMNDGDMESYGNQNTGTDNISAAVTDGYWYSTAPVTNIGSDYEIFVNTPSETGGNVAAITFQPTLNTWISLDTTRLFEITNQGNGVENTYTVEWVFSIRNAATQAVVVSNATLRLVASLFGV